MSNATQIEQDNLPIERKEVRGLSPRLLVYCLVSITGLCMSIQATVLGVYFKVDQRITTLEDKAKAGEANYTGLRVDVDVLKEHRAYVDASIDNLKHPVNYLRQ